ncbi:hypothetical protein PHMEG_00027903 [Phytophthora megakarya]|uniref:Uncharacterized protein n=1 Tax=Phytophthora megakarya TaxID=4795 RepID=A0A225V4J1_9STRA|nr:hypothetical protein PHMEG_00027903 [Phytophthora megakarya]
MELFATLNVRKVEDQQAIERVMAARDKRWLASLGLKGSRTSQSEGDGEEEQADPDAQMAALEEEMVDIAMNTSTETERPVQLSMKLIRECFAQAKTSKRSMEDEDQDISNMLRKKILRLDWLDIGKIENLDAFTHVEELYLQYNLIEAIEGIEDLEHLTFLALAGNRIRQVQNLKHLKNVRSVLPLPASNSPMDHYRALLAEMELHQQDQDLLDQETENKTPFNLTEYEKQRNDRTTKWKSQLTTLKSRTREQLAENGESIKAGTNSRFRERRNLALSRARRSTDAALVDAASHFKQVRFRVGRRKMAN